MSLIFIIGALIALFVRRIFYHTQDANVPSLFVFSSAYFLPQSEHEADSEEVKRTKSKGNTALFAFYILFLASVLSSVFF